MNKCPNCEHRFSDWFTWNGLFYCFLCWRDSGFTKVYTEEGLLNKNSPE